MLLPYKQVLPSTLDQLWMCLHEEVIFPCRLFYWLILPLDEVLNHYSISQFLDPCFKSNITFPSSLISGKIVYNVILSLFDFFKKETWKTKCNSNLYAILQLLCNTLYEPQYLGTNLLTFIVSVLSCTKHRNVWKLPKRVWLEM